MDLSKELVDAFVKVTNDSTENKNESTVYGTIVKLHDTTYVRIDGSDLLTPITSTVAVADGERVTVMIKNHNATVTGNVTSPAAKDSDVQGKANKEDLDVEKGRVDELSTRTLTVEEKVTANEGYISQLTVENETIKGRLDAQEADIKVINSEKISSKDADLKYATIEDANVIHESVRNLEGDYSAFKESSADHFTANDAEIKNLKSQKLSAVDADLKYANIDFSNIGKAAMEYFYAQSGLIKNVTIGDATIAGEIVGVTFRGDLIVGNTIVADKLVIKGEDGLYYKLNTDGVTAEKEQTDYNSLNGQIIRAKSVTAEKVAVDDLVAFGATIGGFHITLHSIFSGVKESATNTTRGIFLGDDGQFAFGDGSDYVKYYRDQNGTYKLAISASEITISAGKNLADAMSDLEKKMDDVKYVTGTEVRYQAGASGTTAPTGAWLVAVPIVPTGQFLWTRTTTKYNIGDDVVSYSVGATGGKGEKGDKGDTGAKGNNTYKSSYECTANQKSIYFSDLKPAVSVSNPPIIGDLVITPSGKMYEIISVSPNVNGDAGNNGGGTYGTGSLLGSIKGGTGSAGRGIQSTAVTYQAGASGTTIPTGTWVSSPPATSADKPYMWTKTVYTYTDGTTSESYTVGATPEGIEVGGRNLLLSTKTFTPDWKLDNPVNVKNNGEYTEISMYTVGSTSNYIKSAYSPFIPIEKVSGKTITFSFEMMLDKVDDWDLKYPLIFEYFNSDHTERLAYKDIYYDDTNLKILSGLMKDGEWFKYGFTRGINDSDVTYRTGSSFDDVGYVRFRLTLFRNGSIRFRKPKLEFGNKATDWTPAPEDVASDITSVGNKADSAQSSANAAQSTANNAQNTADQANDKIDNLEVGGRNLAEKTNQGTTNWGWSIEIGGISIVEVVENGIRTCKMVRDSTEHSGWSVIAYGDIGRSKWEPNTEYTLSVEVKSNVVTLLRPYFRAYNGLYDLIDQSKTKLINDITKVDEWTKLIWIVTSLSELPDYASQNTYFSGMNSAPGTSYQFRNLKLEKGNKATDWTPAPEDVDAAIDEVEKKIELVVASGSSSSSLTLTDSAIAAITKQFKVTGTDGSKTIIEGGKLKVDDLSAISGKFTGSVVASSFKYSEKFGNGTIFFAVEDMHLNFGYKDSNGTFVTGLSVDTSETNISGSRITLDSTVNEGVGIFIEDQIWLNGNTTVPVLTVDYDMSVGGSLKFANDTWNLVGDDVYIGDHNKGGCLCIKSAYSNYNPGIVFYDSSNNEKGSIRSDSSGVLITSDISLSKIILAGNSIYNGPNDSAYGVGGALNNLVISSWWGVSFTTNCGGQTHTGNTAVGIDCRSGKLHAASYNVNGYDAIMYNGNFHVGYSGYDNNNIDSYFSGRELYVRARGHLYRNTTWTAYSDARLKHAVIDLPESFQEAYMDIKPVQFLWNDKPDIGKQAGVIAQQVMQTLYEHNINMEEANIVTLAPDTETYGFRAYTVNYDALNVWTIAVVQKQEKRIKDLEEEIQKLKSA